MTRSRGRPLIVDDAKVFAAYQQLPRYGAIIILSQRFKLSKSTILKSLKRSKETPLGIHVGEFIHERLQETRA